MAERRQVCAAGFRVPKAGASARPWDLAFLPSPFLSTNILKHFRRFLYLSQKAATRISTWLHNRLKYNDLPTSEDGRVAQLGERVLCKHEVAGSIPVTSTNLFCHFNPSFDTFHASLLEIGPT